MLRHGLAKLRRIARPGGIHGSHGCTRSGRHDGLSGDRRQAAGGGGGGSRELLGVVAMKSDHLLQLTLALRLPQGHRATQPQSLLHLQGASGAAARLSSSNTWPRCNAVAGLASPLLVSKLSARTELPCPSQPDRTVGKFAES